MQRLIQWEKHVYETNVEGLEKQIEELATKREIAYGVVSREFPECKRQRHCMSQLSKATIPRFERYREVMKPVLELDNESSKVVAQKEHWDRRYSLRVRAIYNRYLVHEFLKLAEVNAQIRRVLVHSLEVYPSRRDLSEELLKRIDPSFVPTHIGDYDFRMLGQPVDEAAVLATFDIELHPKKDQPNRRFLTTFLMNTYQLDPLGYGSGFLKAWGKRIASENQEEIRKDVFCAGFAIAGPYLLDKLSPGKQKPCQPTREAYQRVSEKRFQDRFNPEFWLLPVSFTYLP